MRSCSGHEPRLDEQVTEAMHRVAGEARTIERRLAQSDWVVGESFSAADMVIYPGYPPAAAARLDKPPKPRNWRRASCRWK